MSIADGWVRSRRRGRFQQFAEINVTSLVDVTLVLLIIFMLTAPFIQGGIDVELPEAESEQTATVEGPVITVDAERKVYLDDDVVPLAQLSEALRDAVALASEGAPVYLKSDEAVPYGFVVRVMSAISAADIQGLSLVVEDERSSGF